MRKDTTHNLTVAAMLSAVAFILMFIEFPVPVSYTHLTGDSTAKSDVVAGFVYIGKINDGGYTQAHDAGRLAVEAMGDVYKRQYKYSVKYDIRTACHNS